jgi:hypothetical protein
MTIAEPLAFAEDTLSAPEAGKPVYRPPRAGAAFQQTESGNGEVSAENLSGLLRRVSKTSIGEIDSLISDLQTLRKKLQTDGERIQSDIAKYTELSQQVMQLTAIITDSVKKLPSASPITH